MLVSHKRQLIFVHLHRTGGASITKQLLSMGGWQQFKGQHDPLSAAKDLKDYRAFAFVRNPWERLVSWYALSYRDGQVCQERFAQFVELWLARLENSKEERFLASQTDYFRDDERSQPCLVGHYEAFDTELSRIFMELGLPLSTSENLNISKHGHYREYYSQSTVEKLQPYFQDDISNFGYSF